MEVNPQDPKYAAGFQRLLQIMNELRAQCPWDREQTMESIRHLSIEEVYELSDAILENDLPAVRKELGDLMLHVVFYAKIASEQGAFDMAGVLEGICEKLVARHPHIYGDASASDAQEVRQRWELLKLKESGGQRKTVLGGVPKSLPALVKAQRIQEKASGVGFDWDDREQVWGKVEEELGELREAEQAGRPEDVEAEFGDLLFALVNYARFIGVNPETALERTNRKFIRRFNYVEEASARDGRAFGEMTLAEMDRYWDEAKRRE
jgi:XTP/dITP diphosphohydrolase